jgi:hypothetical protein
LSCICGTRMNRQDFGKTARIGAVRAIGKGAGKC